MTCSSLLVTFLLFAIKVIIGLCTPKKVRQVLPLPTIFSFLSLWICRWNMRNNQTWVWDSKIVCLANS